MGGHYLDGTQMSMCSDRSDRINSNISDIPYLSLAHVPRYSVHDSLCWGRNLSRAARILTKSSTFSATVVTPYRQSTNAERKLPC